MPPVDIPFLGTIVICATLVSAAYTFAVSLAAARGRPHMLGAARFGMYATCAFVAFGICLLAYAFQTHDFRIRYVARYSDRSMPWWYLVTSLWGGQDGSLLWWSFLLSGWTGLCVRWMRGRYVELQPWVIATLASILGFFQVLMLFAANPFATSPASVPIDGEGLNPLLQNYWMIIHPPTLYMGFVGWSVPFAFGIAALATGRLHDEWIIAIRRWVLMAWLFLSCGLMLGALWSYEELGWGGYWAWDPVENASFHPWLVATAFLHSVMIQERYGMLKLWNAFLICLTFMLTIFGTFLTRSGLIASVHSFAKSDIGVYFVWYMALLALTIIGLLAWRLPKLKSDHRIESLASREFAFLFNNWVLLSMMVVVLVLTTFPLISTWLWDEEVTVGPPTYNRWMVPLGIVLLVLAGVGPLLSWRRATASNLLRAFIVPVAVAIGAGLLHLTVGWYTGFPPYVPAKEVYDAPLEIVVSTIYSVAPLASVIACSFVIATIVQEFWRGTAVRMRARGEGFFIALVNLVSRAKRRYGGYIVHVAIVLMFIGFTGAAYDIEKEAALRPGATLDVGDYRVRYEGARMEVDPNKRMIFADMVVLDEDGDEIATVSPAKFVYRTHPEMPTTEVAILYGIDEDIYVIMSTVDAETKLGTFRVIVRPLVMWIWIGGLLLIFGTFIAVSPSVKEILTKRDAEEHVESMRRRRLFLRLLRVAAALIAMGGSFLILRYGASVVLPLAFTGLGAVALVAGMFALWQSLRTAFGAEQQLAWLHGGSVERMRLVEKKDALLQSLRDVEHEHEVGKISDEDFTEVERDLRAKAKKALQLLDEDVSAYRAEAERIIAEHLAGLERGTPYRDRKRAAAPKEEPDEEVEQPTPAAAEAAVEAPAERKCPSCATWNDPDAVFCKKCATRIEAETEAEAESGTGTGTGSNAESGSDTDTDTDAESESDTESDSEKKP